MKKQKNFFRQKTFSVFEGSKKIGEVTAPNYSKANAKAMKFGANVTLKITKP